MNEDKWGVHVHHSCVHHGCKYGDDDCPVATQQVEQMYACESCYNNQEEREQYMADHGKKVRAKLRMMFRMYGNDDVTETFYDELTDEIMEDFLDSAFGDVWKR